MLVLGLSMSAASAQTLRIGIASDPDILDPTLSRSVAGRQVFATMCDKLVDIDPKLNFAPLVAVLSDRVGMMMSARAATQTGEAFAAPPLIKYVPSLVC